MGASGARAWLGHWGLRSPTSARLRRITLALVVASLAVSPLISGSSAPVRHAPAVAVHIAR